MVDEQFYRNKSKMIQQWLIVVFISFALMLNLNCTVPVDSVETYMVTETRQEPYNVEEKFTINGPSHTEELYSSNGFSDYVGGDRSKVGTEYRFSRNSYKAGTTPAQNIPETNCLENRVYLGGGNFAYYQSRACAGGTTDLMPNMTITLEWKTANQDDEVMGLFLYTDVDATYKNIEDLVPLDDNLMKAYKTAATGKITYRPTDNRPFFVGLVRSKDLSGVIHCWYRATCEWNDMLIGTRNTIKYRDVQVQVEKQRIVTKNQPVSFLGASCGKPQALRQTDASLLQTSNAKRPENAATSTYLTYTDDTNGISFNYPDTWTDVTKIFRDKYDLIAAFQSSQICNLSRPNFNIVTVPLCTISSASEFFETGIPSLQALSQYTAISTKVVMINGSEAVQHNYTNISNSKVIRLQQYFLVNNPTGYIITFSCAPDCFESYENDFDKIANSFKSI
jgi:hypothetical protein